MYFFFIPLFLYLRHYDNMNCHFCINENNNIEGFDNRIKNNEQSILREKILREKILREKISQQNKYYSILERLIDDSYPENRKLNLIEKNINKYFSFNNINNGTSTHHNNKILNKLKQTLLNKKK
jgi:hypothetical protein